MNKLLCLPFFFISSFAFGDYHEIKTYSQKDWNMDFRAKYFLTESNFTAAGGIYQSLPTNYSYQLFDATVGFRATVPQKNLALWGETQFASAQASSPASTRSNSGVTYLKIGTDYIIYDDVVTLIPEFSFTYPLTKNVANVDAAAIGEGVMEVDGRLLAQTRFRYLIMGGFLGFTYRDESRSSLAPYGIYGELAGKTWSFGGNLRGYTSISLDKDSANQTRQNWAMNYNGGSYKFFMPNPQLLETNLWAQIKTTKQLNFLFGIGVALNGANMAGGWNAMAGMTYRFPTGPEASEQRDEVNRFNEETGDGVNQELFKKGKPSTRRNRQQKSNQSLQDQLNQTEMQIEMKSNQGN